MLLKMVLINKNPGLVVDNFSELSKEEIRYLIEEFEHIELNGIPPPGSRQWYVLTFVHWVLGEVIAGRNPLPD